MASKLCCTAEQEGRSNSPELPNARVSEATPAKIPLLPKPPGSPNSRFTSARSEDLHELRQIFDNAKDHETTPASPTKARHSRFTRPSVHSLHSLHKMKSMHSLIRRKFSKDLSKEPSGTRVRHSGVKQKASNADPDTVVKQPKDGPNLQLRITKDDLRKDLLSDKKPDEGGYDPDAEMLDDFARNIAKKTPNKRPSIHSIDWTPSTTSKPTPGSSCKGHPSGDQAPHAQPYQIAHHQSKSLADRFSQVFSSPNLFDAAKDQECALRRSLSATSFGHPEASPALRLPSLKTHDDDSVSWSAALHESLRLSQFPEPPHYVASQRSRASLRALMGSLGNNRKLRSQDMELEAQASQSNTKGPQSPATVVEIRVQEPTSLSSPRPSTSVKGIIRENMPPTSQNAAKEEQVDIEENNPRRSVHLYSMRISHHLRSGSLLSWDNLIDNSDVTTPPRAFRDRSMSDLSKVPQTVKQVPRVDRQTSSSGFASAKVPSKWGRVVVHDFREDKSSIYSSRPQSPPDSYGGSMVDLPQMAIKQEASKSPATNIARPRRSNSYPTDNDETPRPIHRQGLNNIRDVTVNNGTSRLARHNSVASTKRSKFQEEFSPSPPKKRLTPSASIMRFLNPKRSSIRSQSEAAINTSAPIPGVDGSIGAPHAATQRECRLSSSMFSLEVQKDALGNDKKASSMWERALKNHQEEKAAMFLPKNKTLAVHSSPFRERSASMSRLRPSVEDFVSPIEPSSTCLPASALGPLYSAKPSQEPPSLSTRRTAIARKDSEDFPPDLDLQLRFDQQTDAANTVGAWGRYPSHTRPKRTLSASQVDRVETRDFALEAAIKFASGNNNANDDDVDPITRPVSPPLPPGHKKRRKKVGSARMAKSHSMTFGKTFLKNYTKIFRSQSIEFHKHGHGHRSSITTGGTLEYPELEILPDVWRRGVIEERSSEHSNPSKEKRATKEHGSGIRKGQWTSTVEDPASTPRPIDNTKSNTENVMLTLDGQAEQQHSRDTARVWSAYYENCLPVYPRASTEMHFDLDDFGGSARHSLESKRVSIHSRTMPTQSKKHSRNGSRVSCLSMVSNGSARPSFVSLGDNCDRIEERSIVSVRRSTMDLIAMYKEQEVAERERVLGLMREKSTRATEGLLAL